MRVQAQSKLRWSFISVFSVLFLTLSGYSVAAAIMPLPTTFDTEFSLTDHTITADDTRIAELVDSQDSPTAVGWLHSDTAWSNSDEPQQLASLTKLVTVLVSLEAFDDVDMSNGGPTYIWGQKDLQTQADLRARQGIIVPTPVGTKISLRTMIVMSLVPSANDYAIALAEWAYQDNGSFIGAVNEWAKRNDIPSLTLTEPSGMSEYNVATGTDLVKIARLALEHPLISEVMKIQSTHISGIGTFANTNPLLSRVPGVVGVKTGTLSTAGYNLITAQEYRVASRNLTKITVVLGQKSAQTRADVSESLLSSLDEMEEEFVVLEKGTVVGSATAWDNQKIDLIVDRTMSTTLLPSETATLSVHPDSLRFTDEDNDFGVAGFIDLESPTGVIKASIMSTSSPEDPGFWWRLQQPGLVWGWLFSSGT